MGKKIIPVILTNKREKLVIKLRKLKGLAKETQIDIADGKFVNNQTVGLEDLIQVRPHLVTEVHLMVLKPESYLIQAKKAGIRTVIFHFESVKNISTVLKKIKDFGFKRGLAINPETPVRKIKPYLKKLDLVLLMSVRPGFGGQKFLPSTIDKIKALRLMSKDIKIEVDGGINLSNAEKIAKAGADYLVVGVHLLNTPNIKKRFKQLQLAINNR